MFTAATEKMRDEKHPQTTVSGRTSVPPFIRTVRLTHKPRTQKPAKSLFKRFCWCWSQTAELMASERRQIWTLTKTQLTAQNQLRGTRVQTRTRRKLDLSSENMERVRWVGLSRDLHSRTWAGACSPAARLTGSLPGCCLATQLIYRPTVGIWRRWQMINSCRI